MTWKDLDAPQQWDKRKRSRFLLFPMRIEGEWKWFERAYWIENYEWFPGPLYTDSFKWTPVRWITKDRFNIRERYSTFAHCWIPIEEVIMIDDFHGQYRFLSNFWPCPVVYEGIEYQNAEAAYQSAKTLDMDLRRKVFANCDPAMAKRNGRNIEARSNWSVIKERIMYEIVRDKFTRNPSLASRLKETGNQTLVEGNTWGDTYWGVCNGVGENMLGRILMVVRDEL